MLIGKDNSAVHPEELMAAISRSRLGDKLLLSVGLHVALILLTSVPYLVLCARYGSFDPEEAKLRLEEQESKATQAVQAAPAAPATGDEEAATAATAAADEAEPAAEAAGLSPIEQEINEVSGERPTLSTSGFEDIESLD